MRRTFIAAATAAAVAWAPLVALAQEPPAQEPPAQEEPGEEDVTGAGYAEWLSTDPEDDEQDELVEGGLKGLLDSLANLVAGDVADPIADQADFRVGAPTHLTVLSTGVDLDVLGDAAGAVEVASVGEADGSDALGWGTWATSVLLQAAPGATIELVDVYPDRAAHRAGLADALAAIDPSTTDVVLLAFPPGDVLDPTAQLLASGHANRVFDAALDTIVTTDAGDHVVGIPLDHQARKGAEYIGGWSDLRDVRNAARLIATWEAAVDAVAGLVAAGIPVVAPAGDLGPTPQSVLGLAGLPDVVAVGAADAAGTVAPTSARGPSVHGTVKPDVVAPVLFAGLLPDVAAVTDLLGTVDLLDDALPVDLPGEVGATRTASLSTVPAAAQVAAALAARHLAGVADQRQWRGELLAMAVPTAGGDVLAEGAGVLTGLPTDEVLAGRPLVSDHLDLGMEPDDVEDTWAASVEVLGGAAQSPEVVLDRWVGTDANGRRTEAAVAADQAPVVSSLTTSGGGLASASDGPDGGGPSLVRVRDGRLGVFLAPGDNTWQPGVFCGWTRVSLIGTSNDLDTQADIGTGPVAVPEEVPTCLVEGMRLDILNFYIHDVPAQDFTLALLPNLPVGMDLLEGPTMVLPVHPTKERLYSKVSGPDGYATFGAVVPGFYRMRQFSDYSIDVAEDHPGGIVNRDLGNPLTYSQKDALVLPDVVCGVPREQRGGTPHPCHVEQLTPFDLDGEVGYDKTTGRYLVDLPGVGEQGVVLGWAKKMQLTVVSSRYVDVMDGDDWATDSPSRTTQEVVELLADLSQVDELRQAGDLAAIVDGMVDEHGDAVAGALGLTDLWRWTGSPGPGEPLVGQYAGLSTSGNPAKVLGLADYQFAMTTPNYKGSLDWNFTYELEDAAIIAVVEVGGERHVALFTPAGVVSLSPVGTEQPVDPVGLLEVSSADGVARLAWTIHPKGAPSGRMTLLALPLDPMDPARVELGDMSMEVTTWQRVEWPPLKHDRNGALITGHQFDVQPRYADFGQMDDDCRAVGADLTGGFAGEVCEEWNVILHSGKYDVETFRILDGTSGADLTGEVRPAGGMFHDPRHGITDATLALAHDMSLDGVADLDQGVRRELRSNGEFFEMLHLPTDVVAAHPDHLVVQVADNIVGREATGMADHRNGRVPLSGYLRFAPEHRDVEGVAPAIPGEVQDVPTLVAPGGASSRTVAAAPPELWCDLPHPSNGLVTARVSRRVLGSPTTPDQAEALLSRLVDRARADLGDPAVAPLARTHDLDAGAEAWTAAMAASGTALVDPELGSTCCWTDLHEVVARVDTANGLDVGVRAAFDQAMDVADHRDAVLAQGADHLGVAVLTDAAGVAWLSLRLRAWDGSELPPPPADTTNGGATGGGGAAGGGGGGAAAGGGGGRTAPTDPATTDSGDASTTGPDDASSQPTAEAAPPTSEAEGSTSPAQPGSSSPESPTTARPGADVVVRHHGPSRVATAAAISRASFDRADVVLLASANGFADALAGAPLAASSSAPLLLNPPDVGVPFDGRGLAYEVAAELERLQPATVILLGGTKVLGTDVAHEVVARFGATVERVSGPDRFATAVAIAERVGDRHRVGHAYLVEGTRAWADAVSAASVAGWRQSPILLTRTDLVPAATLDHLQAQGITEVTIVGGRGVVSTAVEFQLASLGIGVDRLRGPDRYATSAAVATHGQAHGMSTSAVWLATGRNYPDALAAAAAAASAGTTVLLVDGHDPFRSEPSLAWLHARAADIRWMVVAGGHGAVAESALATLRMAAE